MSSRSGVATLRTAIHLLPIPTISANIINTRTHNLTLLDTAKHACLILKQPKMTVDILSSKQLLVKLISVNKRHYLTYVFH